MYSSRSQVIRFPTYYRTKILIFCQKAWTSRVLGSAKRTWHSIGNTITPRQIQQSNHHICNKIAVRCVAKSLKPLMLRIRATEHVFNNIQNIFWFGDRHEPIESHSITYWLSSRHCIKEPRIPSNKITAISKPIVQLLIRRCG
jgi:hypothetical protein